MDEQKISQFLKEIHETMPRPQVVPTIHCEIEPDIVMVGCTLIPKPAGFPILDQHPNDHGQRPGSSAYVSFTFRTGDSLDEACFKHFTENLPWELFRMKEPVRFRDRTVLVNYVGGKNEWTVWRHIEETCLVFVGWKVEERDTLQKLANCVAGP